MAAASGSVSRWRSAPRPARWPSRRTSTLNGPQLAGWVIATRSGGALLLGDGRAAMTNRNRAAVRRSAEYGVVPSMIGAVSPMRRLNSRASRAGSSSPGAPPARR